MLTAAATGVNPPNRPCADLKPPGPWVDSHVMASKVQQSAPRKAPFRAPAGAFNQVQRAVVVMGTGIVVAAAVPLIGRSPFADLLSLAFLAGVLWTGAFGGPGPGAVAAITAAGGYAIMRAPDIVTGAGGASVAIRSVVFILVGVGTGSLVARLKDILVKIESSGLRDNLSTTYSSAYMHELIRLLVEEHVRYGKGFGLLEVPPVLAPEEVAILGRALKKMVRSSDTVGRSSDGGFLILLSNGDRDSVEVAARRLRADCASAGRTEIPIRSYSAPDDVDALQKLVAEV